MKTWNANTIVSIEVIKETVSNHIKWHNYTKKTFWTNEEQEGFYEGADYQHIMYTKDTLNYLDSEYFNYFSIDNIVYIKARVIVTFINNKTLIFHLPSDKEADYKAVELNKFIEHKIVIL